MLGAVLSCFVITASPSAADVAVVCPPAFRSAIEPWIRYREQQGRRIALVTDFQSPQEIRRQLRDLAKSGSLRYVVLIGDAEPLAGRDEAVRVRTVPTLHVEAKVVHRFGSEPDLASDNGFADLDGDGLPDVAIGRITADSPEELAAVTRKIIRYEQNRDFGAWRRKINFVAGVGGFSRLVDGMVEMTTKKLLTDGLPAAFETTMTYGSWQSPYCPHPRSFAAAAAGRLNEGCLFWVYMGHGHYRELDRLPTPGEVHRILDVDDVARLRCAAGSPIAMFMSCYAGAFDATKDCLAEEMLRTEGAPVAVVCGSRVTMPYGMSVLGLGLLKQCFHERRETLGEALLYAKRDLAGQDDASPNRRLLDSLAKMLSPSADALADERLEHVQLFNLLGDPLLRLRHPREIALRVPEQIRPGQTIEISGVSPFAGSCHVELVARRDLLTFTPTVRQHYDASAAGVVWMNQQYEQANDRRWAERATAVEEGLFHITLDVPPVARGHCYVRIYIAGQEGHASGAVERELRLK